MVGSVCLDHLICNNFIGDVLILTANHITLQVDIIQSSGVNESKTLHCGHCFYCKIYLPLTKKKLSPNLKVDFGEVKTAGIYILQKKKCS